MNFRPIVLLRLFLIFFLAGNLRAQTVTNFIVVTNDSLLGALLQVQEQLHAARLQIESNRAVAEAEAQKNSDAVAGRLQLLEQAVQNQRAVETDTARLSFSSK